MKFCAQVLWIGCLAGLVCNMQTNRTLAQAREVVGDTVQAKPAEAPSETVFSGPQVGEKLPELPVWISGGKDKPASKADLAVRNQSAPLAIAFMHERSRPAFQLVRILSQFAELRKDAGFELHVVVLSEDRSSSEQWLGQIGGYFNPPTELSVAEGGIEGPGALGLNRLMDMTILVAKEGKVTANFALTQVSAATDAPPILKAINDISGGGEIPSIDKLVPQAGQRASRGQASP